MLLSNVHAVGPLKNKPQIQPDAKSERSGSNMWTRSSHENKNGSEAKKSEDRPRGGKHGYHDYHNVAVNPTGRFNPQGAVHLADTNQMHAMRHRAADLFKTVQGFPTHLGQLGQNFTNYARTHHLSNVTPGQFKQNMQLVACSLQAAYKKTSLSNGPNGKYDPYFGNADAPFVAGDLRTMPVGNCGVMAFGRNSKGVAYVEYREN